jgi:hypothetical protein
MINIRTKASAAVAAAILGIGCALGATTLATTPAYAAPAHAVLSGTVPVHNSADCNYTTSIHNGSDYLDDYGHDGGDPAYTYPFTGSNNQVWCLQYASGGYYIFSENDLNNCLTASGGAVSGATVYVDGCNGSENQQWCWNGSGYLTTALSSAYALRDVGTYEAVAVYQGGSNNKWSTDGVSIPDPC